MIDRDACKRGCEVTRKVTAGFANEVEDVNRAKARLAVRAERPIELPSLSRASLRPSDDPTQGGLSHFENDFWPLLQKLGSERF
jgi:hypothetical protein